MNWTLAFPRLLVVATAVAVTCLLGATGASASSGGQDPSSAPGVAAGSHGFSSCDNIDYEFWALPGLINDDQVTLDFSGASSYSHVYILPPSADDFNWQNVNALNLNQESGNDKQRLTFTASEGDGRYLIYVSCAYTSGAYDFLVESIKHTVRVDIAPRPSSILYRGRFSASVINADAAPISDPSLPFVLYGSWGGATRQLGTAAASGGRVSFAYALPKQLRRKRISIWVATGGTGSYLGASSSRILVTVR